MEGGGIGRKRETRQVLNQQDPGCPPPPYGAQGFSDTPWCDWQGRERENKWKRRRREGGNQ